MPAATSDAMAAQDMMYPIEQDGVRRVKFSVMTAEEIRTRAACEVTGVELFSGGTPVEGGLYDARMGVTDFNMRCATCHQSNKLCPGHPSFIELAAPVFNPLFLESLKRVLRCICLKCAKACFSESYILRSDAPSEAALAHAAEESSKVRDCPYCGTARGERIQWNKQSISTFTYQHRNETDKHELSSTQIYDLLCRVTDDDVAMMGLSGGKTRPDAFMFKALPVVPVSARPPHRSGTQRRDDDITHQLWAVVKRNRTVASKLAAGTDPSEMTPIMDLLQLDIMQLIENSGNSVPQAKLRSTNRPLKSIASRLKGKDGRVRSHLLGKRVDFSARSVITAEPNISLDEVGIPIRIAMTLTFPEVVHAGNYDRLRRTVANGPAVYPGARMLRQGAVTVSLERAERRVRTELRIGDTVERHMIDGDVVLVNRQPSLHRMSMMCHRVRVMPFDTLRLNVLVTESYGADFDGDEMNVHLPQSASTAIEIARLATVRHQIISPRHHRPIVGVVQDVALGAYLLTQDSTMVDANTAANICARCSETMPEGPVTGKQLFSSLLPSTLNCAMTDNARIVSGNLLTGSIGKAQYQQEGAGILHSVYLEDGPDAAVRLLDNTQAMSCDWLVRTGFSMGARDLAVSSAGRTEVAKLIEGAKADVDEILAGMHAGKLRNESSDSDMDDLERRIRGKLDVALASVLKICEAEGVAINSRLLSMIRAKSKGNLKNLVQMTGMLGQNFIDGKRIPRTLGDRCLPHFCRHDDSAAARGFIGSSFRDGLKPHEFFFHAMAGREGLIDTAVKSVTGDTRIVVTEGVCTRTVAVGEWIDARMDVAQTNVEHHQDRNLELLKLSDIVNVPTVDSNGAITWSPVTAITRHDPGEALFRATTKGGRSVTVSANQSLLVVRNGSIVPELPANVKVGDVLPACANLPPPPVSQTLYAHLDRAAGAAVGLRVIGADALARPTRGTPLDTFLQAEVGSGTNLRIPDLAFSAPEAFIEGVMCGVFCSALMAGIGNEDLVSPPVPRHTANALAMLCARLGVYATICRDAECCCSSTSTSDTKCCCSVTKLVVKDVWAAKLAARAGLKGTQPDTGSAPNQCGDAALDEVVEIVQLGTEGHAKLYDLTVPATLNFGLANGLMVRDTSETGYLQRKLVKALEDLQVASDGSVRDASHGIVSFKYGGDGMDACAVESQAVPTFGGGLMHLVTTYLVSHEDDAEFEKVLAPEAFQKWKAISATDMDRLRDHFRNLVEDKHFVADMLERMGGTLGRGVVAHAIGFERIIVRCTRAYNSLEATSDLDPIAILDASEALARELFPEDLGSRALGAILVRAHISPKPMIRRGVTQKALAAIVGTVRARFYTGLVSTAEMVGIIAAQSIAEPSTQMTLSSFHNTGLAATKASVPRIKELVSVSRNPKSTTYIVKLLEGPTSESAEFASVVRDRILCTHVRDLVARSQMLCENGERYTETDERLHKLEGVFAEAMRAAEVHEDDSNVADAANVPQFIMRLEMDSACMQEHAVTMLDVHAAIFARVHANVVVADDASDQLVIRVAPFTERAADGDLMAELRALETAVLDTRIKGIRGVEGCIVMPEEGRDVQHVYDHTAADFVERAQFWVQAAGTTRVSVDDLLEIAMIPGVDSTQTVTDNLCHIASIFGIEAARTFLLRELQAAYSSDTYADFRHIELLVDYMTRRGVLTAITRHGIGATNAGPLTKCSFEQTVLKLVQAGTFAEEDPMTGVSANIMIGATAPCGTGNSMILWDADAAAQLPDGEVVEAVAMGRRQAFSLDTITMYSPYANASEPIPHIEWSSLPELTPVVAAA